MKQQLNQLENLFKALADGTRLRILGLLVTGEVCVCHIHESLRITQPKASRHLAYLRRSGLVETRRQGLWVYYRLSDSSDPILRTIRHAVAHVLGHVDVVHRDTDRLQKKTGCGFPESRETLKFMCCGEQAGSSAMNTSA
jgi:ArsR family transcriptional regulator